MKLPKLATVLTTATLIGILSSSFSFAASSQDKGEPSLVALGDSITFGYDLDNNHHPSKDAFPYLIAHADHFRVRDLGVIGSTTNDLLQALQTPKYQEAISHANYVTLDIGGDDLLQISSGILQKLKADPTYTPSTPELLQLQGALNNLLPTISSNLSHIVQEIRLLNPKAPILLYNLYNPFPVSNPILHGLGEQIVTPVNQIIGVVASNPLIILVDDHQSFTGNELTYVRLTEYDIHPTVEGQENLAELGLKAINELP